MPLGMLGKYERLDILGHGASGIVYLAQDTLLKKRVALKEISAQGDEKHRVLEEARVLDRLRHPNIVAVNSVDTIDGKVIIDMEYVQGSNLLDILRRADGPLPLPDCISIASQICDGLAYAHGQRTVHRDIKPANILVSDQHVVKLADFGLAQVLGTNSYAGGAGTFAYMAPEDFDEQGRSDRQSDIWAVGVILYEMLTGHRPITVANPRDPFAWARALAVEEIKPPSFFRTDISSNIDSVCIRALGKDKADRYESASEMASDLRAAAGYDDLASISPTASTDTLPGLTTIHQLDPVLQSFVDIDGLLRNAPDHWDDLAALLTSGELRTWLISIGEPLIAKVAGELELGAESSVDSRLRDFLYRAGLNLERAAKDEFLGGSELANDGLYPEAIERLQLALRIDPDRPAYYQKLAQTAREAGDVDLMRGVLGDGIVKHPKDRALKTFLASVGGALPEVSLTELNFGPMHHGEVQKTQLTLRAVGTDFVKGRVASAPGWLTVAPLIFNNKGKQILKVEADSTAVHSEAGDYSEPLVLETTGGIIELPVSLSIVAIPPSLAETLRWYLPVLLSCMLPAVVGNAATDFSHRNSQALALLPAGLIMSGCLFMSFLAVNIAYNSNLFQKAIAASGISVGLFGTYNLLFHASTAPSSLEPVWPITVITILLAMSVPVFQTISYLKDRGTYDKTYLWCIAIVVAAAVGSALIWNAAQ